MPTLSIIVPTLNAAAHLAVTLAILNQKPAALRREILVVDGASSDATVAVANGGGARVLHAPRGRGTQLMAGIAAARAPWLLLLHADTRPGADWPAVVSTFVAAPGNAGRAGYFAFELDDPAPPARRLERWVAWRCRVLALPYGDQGLLISRTLLQHVGGVRPLPLMEDVDLVRRLGRARLAPLPLAAVTSARRFRGGYRRRSARNLACLALWWIGVPAGVVARLYGR